MRIKQFHITYPVALDNDYQTWENLSEPLLACGIFDRCQGHIRRTHFGEGGYDHMEEAIRALLKENGHALRGI